MTTLTPASATSGFFQQPPILKNQFTSDLALKSALECKYVPNPSLVQFFCVPFCFGLLDISLLFLHQIVANKIIKQNDIQRRHEFLF